MSDRNAATWANESDRKKYLRRRKIANIKGALSLWWHGVFWTTLHALRIGRPYSVTMCKLGLYRKFPEGRCMWCGNVH